MTRLFLIAPLLFVAAPPLTAQEPAADTGRVYAVHEVTERPRATNAAELVQALQASYPAEGAGRSGQVEVAVVIGPDGTVAEARVVRSTDPVFDTPTVSAVRVLRFTPAAVEGRPVAVRVNLPIRWEPAPVAQADAQGVYQGAEVDEPPLPRNVQAVRERMMELYPPALRAAGQGGEVVLRLLVDEQGAVRDARVERSSNPALDSASLQVAGALEFFPARTGGQTVRAWAVVPLQWQVDAGEAQAAAADDEADGDTAHAYELSAVTERPRIRNASTLLRELERRYPPQLRDSRQEGSVSARFRVAADGTVSRIRITRSSHHAFAEPTVEALRLLRFHPARLNGRPVATWVELPIVWTVSTWIETPNPVPWP